MQFVSRFILFLLLGAVAHCANAADQPLAKTGTLTLRNGSNVAGQLSAMDSADFIRWHGTDFVSPFEFYTSGVTSIAYPPATPQLKLEGEFAIELQSGDFLAGQILNWSDGFVELKTARFGTVHIREAALRRLDRIDRNPSLVFSGLSGLSDWKTVTGEWQTEGAQIFTDQPSAGLTNDFQIPAKAMIEFELSWKQTPNFRFVLGADLAAKDELVGGWSFETFNNTLVLVRETESVASVEPILSATSPVNRIRLMVFLDQPAETIHVYRPDGSLLVKMSLPNDEESVPFGDVPLKSTGIVLLNNQGQIRLERLRVSQWNGNLPLETGNDSSRFQLADGTSIGGNVTGYDSASRTLSIEQGSETKSVPLDKLTSAEFAPVDKTSEQPLTAILQDQSRLSGELIRVDDKHVLMTSLEIKDPLPLPREFLRSLVISLPEPVFDKPATKPLIGRLELNLNRLQGELVPGTSAGATSCLIWKPTFSRTSSPLVTSAAGSIVYRERKPPPPKQPQETAQQRMLRERQGAQQKNVFAKFGDLFLKNADKPQARKRKEAVETEPHDIHLLTGDVVPCQINAIDQHGVRITSTVAEVDLIPHAKIKAVVWDRKAKSPKLEKAKKERLLTLPRNQKSSPPTHLLCATTGDFLRCRVVSLTEENLRIEVQLSEIEIPRDRVSHMIWLHPKNLLTSDDGTVDAPLVAEKPAAASAGDSLAQVILPSGNRSTFAPREVTSDAILGESDVIGKCRFELSRIDQLVFGTDIKVATSELPFQQWVLQSATEPLYLTATTEGGSADDGLASALVDKPAPDFKLDLLDGTPFTLSEAQGKIIVLDFWATWCGPCMLTMPLMEEAMAGFDPARVQMISVNLEERPAQVKEVLARHQLNPTVAMDIDGVVARRYQVDSIPSLVIVDEKGTVARLYIGGGQGVVDQFKAALTEMLAAPPAE